MSLAALLSALAGQRFISYRLAPKPNGKSDKLPTNPWTGHDVDAQDPASWMTAEQAAACASAGWGVGVVVTEDSGLFCIDLDSALDHLNQWTPLAVSTCQRFAGAAVEISVSGKGLHILGRCAPLPPHRTRKKGFPVEVYTRARFIAITGTGLAGDINSDHTAALVAFIAEHLPEAVGERDAQWTTGPYAGWRGGGTDDQIIATLRTRTSARAIFGNGATFSDLYDANTEALQRAYPDGASLSGYDESAADQALANHLAWATGYDCERALALMQASALRREKWERHDYLPRTITRAIAGKIPEGSRTAEQFAEEPQITPDSGQPAPLVAPAAPPVDPPAVLSAAVPQIPATGATPSANAIVPAAPGMLPGGIMPGHHVLAHEQARIFEGCVYVRDMHQILMPDGGMVASGPFNATYGGAEFQMTVDGQRPTKEAWNCFLFSEVTYFPRVTGVLFDPKRPPREMIYRDGQPFLNTYQPVYVEKTPGDVSLFLSHIRKLYPADRDYEILLAYLAALVQHQGVKFSWAPFLQGVEGNGKTLLSQFVEYAISPKFTHWPTAKHLGKQFNAAFYGKLLICVEDVKISEDQGSLWEMLKPMITGVQLEIEPKGVDSKVVRDVCFNFILNSNHKSGLRKTQNDRRICPLFGAQQIAAHLARDGLTEDYFDVLNEWAKAGGYAHVAHFLSTYDIPEDLNPAGKCRRAPQTSSTDAAIHAGRGAVEQEIFEAIAQGTPGFRGGWINSMALDSLLHSIGKARYITRNVRREMLEGMGFRVHPRLGPEGRTLLPDNTRPVLYITGAHVSDNDSATPLEVAQLYGIAQTTALTK